MDQSVTIPVSSLDHVKLEYGPRFEYAPAEGETRGRIGLPPDGIPPHFWGIYMRSSDGHAVHIDDVADEDIARAYGAISEELLTDSAMSLWEAVCTAEPASRLANHADPVRSINGTAYLRDRAPPSSLSIPARVHRVVDPEPAASRSGRWRARQSVRSCPVPRRLCLLPSIGGPIIARSHWSDLWHG